MTAHPPPLPWATNHLATTIAVDAPDRSEVRPLVSVSTGSLVHCRLEPGQTTRAVRHQTVQEVWYCLSGHGQVWRRELATGRDDVVDVTAGVALTIPLGIAFQFRALDSQPLELLLTTMPPWPGPDEAVAATGPWTPTL